MTDAPGRCPFCGNEAFFGEVGGEGEDAGGHFIQCTADACGASTKLIFACGEDPKPLLLERWNRRADRPTSSDGSVEAVARAICETQTKGEGFWPSFIPEAAAALAASRAPEMRAVLERLQNVPMASNPTTNGEVASQLHALQGAVLALRGEARALLASLDGPAAGKGGEDMG
jgi:hypothetical protein